MVPKTPKSSLHRLYHLHSPSRATTVLSPFHHRYHRHHPLAQSDFCFSSSVSSGDNKARLAKPQAKEAATDYYIIIDSRNQPSRLTSMARKILNTIIKRTSLSSHLSIYLSVCRSFSVISRQTHLASCHLQHNYSRTTC